MGGVERTTSADETIEPSLGTSAVGVLGLIASMLGMNAVLSVIATGSIEAGFVLDLFVAMTLPLISLGLSWAGILPAFDLWVWYVIVMGWVLVVLSSMALVGYWWGLFTRSMRWNAIRAGIFGTVWMGFVAVVAVVVGFTQGYGIRQMVALGYLLVSPFTLGVPLLSDLSVFDFSTPVWVLVVLLWIAYLRLNAAVTE